MISSSYIFQENSYPDIGKLYLVIKYVYLTRRPFSLMALVSHNSLIFELKPPSTGCKDRSRLHY